MTAGEYLEFKFWLLGRIETLNQRLEHTSNMLTKIDFEARKNVLEEVLGKFEENFNEAVK